MSFAANALVQAIEDEFGGRKKKLAEAAKLPPTVISKLIHRQKFGPETLKRVCDVLSDKNGERLCRAVCRDFLPEKFGSIKTHPKNPEAPFPLLDDKTRGILFKIAERAEHDRGTREWLQQLSTWMFPE